MEMALDQDELKEKMEAKRYLEVFNQIKSFIQDNPMDKNAKKLYNKFLNEYKKREQKEIFANVESKMSFNLYDEAIPIIEEYIENY